MIRPKVSVIIPAFNTEDYIRRCIESVLNQTLQDFEIICVDDFSTDSTTAIINEIRQKDNRIRLISNESNLGPGISRSRGCDHAQGEYVFFLDGDDSLPDNALAVLYALAQESGADIVKGEMRLIYDTSGQVRYTNNSLPYGSEPGDIYRSLLEKRCVHNLCATLFSMRLLTGYPYATVAGMRNGEDAYFFYQMVNNVCNGMSLTHEIVYNYYCENMSSSTHVRISDVALDKLMLLYEYIHELPVKYGYLKEISESYLTRELSQWAVICGYRRFVGIAKKYSCFRFVSIGYRVKHLTLVENVKWLIKLVIGALK